MARLTRIPLDVVVAATGERTSGKVVAVVVDELDAEEDRYDQLWEATGELLDALRDELRYEVGIDKHVRDRVEAVARNLGGPFKSYESWED